MKVCAQYLGINVTRTWGGGGCDKCLGVYNAMVTGMGNAMVNALVDALVRYL